MDRTNGDDHERVSVTGFEVPTSPDSSYNNPIPGIEDEAREPPLVPPHLEHTVLNYLPSQDDPSSLSVPQNVILNHLYIENRDRSRSAIALGITHRFLSKYVTVVLYKPVQRR
ncbi:SNF1-related protein kinase regulatory subunit beta-3-like [Curcuma longa]|uniref:SNF1-related protein kinase regulatory subunit beta-3-like n=1 Tax=Curcuma longa TaxID=136217 RepID=UPI003D9E5079